MLGQRHELPVASNFELCAIARAFSGYSESEGFRFEI
jgi:hypothetical protein